MLAYKLEERGGKLIKVNPAYTSQTCAECGTISKSNRESQAKFECVSCGHKAHADINAARNILRAGMRPQSAPSEPHKRSATRTVKENVANAA